MQAFNTLQFILFYPGPLTRVEDINDSDSSKYYIVIISSTS